MYILVVYIVYILVVYIVYLVYILVVYSVYFAAKALLNSALLHANKSITISVGDGEAEWRLVPPQLGRNPFNSGNSVESTVGNSGNFSDCSPYLSDISGRKFTPP